MSYLHYPAEGDHMSPSHASRNTIRVAFSDVFFFSPFLSHMNTSFVAGLDLQWVLFMVNIDWQTLVNESARRSPRIEYAYHTKRRYIINHYQALSIIVIPFHMRSCTTSYYIPCHPIVLPWSVCFDMAVCPPVLAPVQLRRSMDDGGGGLAGHEQNMKSS